MRVRPAALSACMLLSCVLLAPGCSTSDAAGITPVGPPKVTDYSTGCAVATDCVVIDTSSDACCGGCANAAIAKSDFDRYQADRNRFRSTCSSLAPCPDRRCEMAVATCEGGTCKASAPVYDAGTDAKPD